VQGEYVFDVSTPIGFRVHVTADRWRLISVLKHPTLSGRETDVSMAIEAPDEIRRSRQDGSVLLFYRRFTPVRWICAVVKVAGEGGFLITAYPASTLKTGERVWSR
jgi:hypothetical protein